MDLPVLLLLAAAAIGGNVLLALALRHGAKRKAGIAELVARNGWRQETRHEGRVSREVIGDPAEGWVLETARPHQTTDGRRSYRTTWRAPDLIWCAHRDTSSGSSRVDYLGKQTTAPRPAWQ